MFYGYVRVSTEAQASNTSPAEQERELRLIAELLKIPPESVMIFKGDLGVSGSIAFGDRKDGKSLLELAKAGDTIAVTKLDRAFRSTKDAINTVEGLQHRGVHLIIHQMFGIEPVTSSAIAKLMFTMLAAFAEWERTLIVERTERGRSAKRAAGGILGGRLSPFGFRKEGKGKDAYLVPVVEEQIILVEVLAMINNGLNDYRIAKNLTRRGIVHTRTKEPFVHQHIKSMRDFAERKSAVSLQSL